ncbi:MAG: metal ABC transporter permease, partial [Acidobacteriota bacterium]|nr:metal ABC transporter permease [Acidobacteriota bacterium]
LAPHRGLLVQTRDRARRRWLFAQRMLAVHIFNHQDTPEAAEETAPERLHVHLKWKTAFSEEVVRRAEERGLVKRGDGVLRLTPRGLETARRALSDDRVA